MIWRDGVVTVPGNIETVLSVSTMPRRKVAPSTVRLPVMVESPSADKNRAVVSLA
jgi:hypothetical protein